MGVTPDLQQRKAAKRFKTSPPGLETQELAGVRSFQPVLPVSTPPSVLAALVLNTGDANTAVGTVALLLNTTGTQSTAVGTDAMVFNDSGSGRNAVGYFALMNQTTTGSNTAVGWEAHIDNTTGFNNAALGVRAFEFNINVPSHGLGNLALDSSETTSDHVAVGRHAGDGITTANNNVIVGHHYGVHSVFGEISDRCFIENIYGAPVSAGMAALCSSIPMEDWARPPSSDPGGFSPKSSPAPSQSRRPSHAESQSGGIGSHCRGVESAAQRAGRANPKSERPA